MITREQLEQALADSNYHENDQKIDYQFKIISMLRERIPYEVCDNIITHAEHDQIVLPYVDECLEYITEKDIDLLAKGNCFIDEDSDSLSLWV